MPWTAADAPSHTDKADSEKKKKVWAQVANKALEDGDSEASAIKQANSAVAKMGDKGTGDDSRAIKGGDQTTTKEGLPSLSKTSGTGKTTVEAESTGETAEDEDEEKKKEQELADQTEADERQEPRPRGKMTEDEIRENELAHIGRRELALRSSSFDLEAREADAVVSTGCSVRRKDFWSGEEWNEVLEVSPGAVRLGRLNAGAQLLDSHDHFGGLDAVIGAVVPGSARIDNGRVLARFKFSTSPKGERIARDLAAGIPFLLSAGYKIHKEQRDATSSPETRRAIDWEPMEVSVVTVPAEGEGTGFRGQSSSLVCRALPAYEEVKQMTEISSGSTTSPIVDVSGEVRRQLETERSRVADIMSIARQAGLDNEIAETAIREGRTPDQFRVAAFDQLAKRSAAHGINGGSAGGAETGGGRWDPVSCRVIRDEVEGRADAMAEAMVVKILSSRREPAVTSEAQAEWVKAKGRVDQVAKSFRISDGQEQPANPRAKEYFDRGFSEIAAECLGYRGHIRTPQRAYEIIARAMQSTSDFPAIFENVLNKTLLARYQLAMPTYRELAAERPFNDFRPHPQVRGGEFPMLEALTETGEIRYGSTADSKETVSVLPYGKIWPISRQMIVNDEMGAIDQILGTAGDMVLVFENRTFFTMLTANPTLLQDSTAVFADTHGNYSSPGAPPSITSIGTMRAALRAMKSISGWYLNVPPRIILTGPLTETVADQMVATISPTLTTSVNPFSGRLRSVSDANITDHSWYLFSEPGRIPNFVYGFLQGATGPRVRTDEPFGVQGIRVSIEHDFGCGAIDYRGAFLNAGAGTVVSGG